MIVSLHPVFLIYTHDFEFTPRFFVLRPGFSAYTGLHPGFWFKPGIFSLHWFTPWIFSLHLFTPRVGVSLRILR